MRSEGCGMGTLVSCFRHGDATSEETVAGEGGGRGAKQQRSGRSKNNDGMTLQDEAILAMALRQHQRLQARMERTTSQRSADSATSFMRGQLPRSLSARPRSVTDPLLNPGELVIDIQDKTLPADLESNHFVLIHGGGHGAWCWYKSIALLEDAGFVATAIDLVGSGIDSEDPNAVLSLSQYVKPLLTFLQQLPENEKVILVGHNVGGACISYAMECFPEKISKAVFVAATMVASGQRAYDVFTQQAEESGGLLNVAQKFIFANGGPSPTAIEFDKKVLKDLFYNMSPAKDVALATVAVRPVPFAPAMEKLNLTREKYGTVRRYYIETSDDNVFTPAIHETVQRLNPPEKVFRVKGSDHSPFFSKPQSLNKVFREIAMLR